MRLWLRLPSARSSCVPAAYIAIAGSRDRGGNFIEKRLAEARNRDEIEIGSDHRLLAHIGGCLCASRIGAIDCGAAEPRHLSFDGRGSLLVGGICRRGFCAVRRKLPGRRGRSKGRLRPHPAARLFGLGQHSRPCCSASSCRTGKTTWRDTCKSKPNATGVQAEAPL